MDAIASQITSLTIVYATVYSGADQRKHESSASLAFVRGIHRVLAQMASNAENVSIWWRHHVQTQIVLITCSVKYGMKLLIHSQTSSVQPLKFGNR